MDSDDDRLEIAEDNPPTPAGQQHQSSLNTKTFVANKPWRQQQSEAAMSSNADAVESLLMLSGMGSPTHQPGPPPPPPSEPVRPRASSMSFLTPSSSTSS